MTILETTRVVTISPKAADEIRRLILESNEPGKGLRLGVKGGGCSGLSYVIDFGIATEKDIVQEEEGFLVFIDRRSSLYLKDSILEYTGGLADRGFKFRNPNAQNTCGCGESFSV
jgi:iron-sulfur cluster assembly protein